MFEMKARAKDYSINNNQVINTTESGELVYKFQKEELMQVCAV